MTTRNEGPDESGGVKATADATTTISESADYGDEPPRILMGINDAPVQAPDGAVFNTDGEIAKHELTGPFDKDKLLTVLRTVRKRLGDDYAAVWKTQEKPIEAWGKDKNEERWAQKFSERYVGITYGGPGQSYFGGGQWDGYIFSRAQPRMRKVTLYEYTTTEGNKVVTARRGTTQVSDWNDPEKIPVKHERPPNQCVLGEWEDNDDPAIPIIGACQQTTSYGAIAHGFTVEDDLQYAGYAASEHSGVLPIFTGKKPIGWPGEPVQGGKFYTVGSKSKGAEFKTLTDLQALRNPGFACDTKNIDPPMAPGTIITYNPHGFIKSVRAMITPFEEAVEIMRVRAEICRAMQGDPNVHHAYSPPARDWIKAPAPTSKRISDWLDAVTSTAAYPKRKDESDDQYKLRKGKWDDEKRKQAKHYDATRETAGDVEVELPTSVQDPGSHIAFVLRVSGESDPAKRRVQLFDTSSNTAYWVMEQQARRGIIARPIEGGIMDGCAFPSHVRPKTTQIPANSPMVGIGVTPKPDPARLEAHLKSLENARPVGLLRFVLTLRKPPEVPKPPNPWATTKPKTAAEQLGPDLFPNRYTWAGDIHADEVLYISRLLRMYGDKKDENFYISRLLRSLRATPYFTHVQAWWFVFAPTGLLAKSMWSRGAREMRPRDFVQTVLKLPKYFDKKTPDGAFPDPWAHRTDIKLGTHYQLTHVLTATGSDVPKRIAKAFTWCRKKSALADGGSTSLKVEGYAVPKDILRILESLGCADEYTTSKLADAVPAPDAGRAGSDEIDWFRYG